MTDLRELFLVIVFVAASLLLPGQLCATDDGRGLGGIADSPPAVSTKPTSHAPTPPAKKQKTPPPALRFQVSVLALAPDSGNNLPRELRQGDVLHSGDMYRIIIVPHQRSWIYVFQTDPRGAVYQLFPPRGEAAAWTVGQNPVPRQGTLLLPAPGRYYTLDSNAGAETIYVLVSSYKDHRLEQRYEQTLSQGGGLTGQQFTAQLRTRGLAGIVAAQPLSVQLPAAQGAPQTMEIKSDVQQSKARQGLFFLEFQHH